MDFLPRLFFFLVLIPSAILHEYMHGYVADRLGDPTAKYAGRLTLDPRVHIDLFGSILLPLALFFTTGLMFAYAKPVPYNPYNLRNQKWGPVMVAFAGPLSNLFLALVFGLLIQFVPFSESLTFFLSIIVYVNVVLAVFNLVPIPPLDGSKLLLALLPDSLQNLKQTLERFGFVLLIVFIFYFSGIISPITDRLFLFFTGGQGIF